MSSTSPSVDHQALLQEARTWVGDDPDPQTRDELLQEVRIRWYQAEWHASSLWRKVKSYFDSGVEVAEDNGFAALGLPEVLVERLARDAITTPFAIQAAAIPDALAGKDRIEVIEVEVWVVSLEERFALEELALDALGVSTGREGLAMAVFLVAGRAGGRAAPR